MEERRSTGAVLSTSLSISKVLCAQWDGEGKNYKEGKEGGNSSLPPAMRTQKQGTTFEAEHALTRHQICWCFNPGLSVIRAVPTEL